MQKEKKELKINITSFDLIKGIMILVVVMSHIIQVVGWHDWLLTIGCYLLSYVGWAFMPAFAIISGFSFKEKDPTRLLKNTATNLCKPCFWVSLITIVLALIPHYLLCYHSWSETIHFLTTKALSFALGIAGPNAVVSIGQYVLMPVGVIWFLWALFVAQNVLNLILRRYQETWKRTILVLLCAAAGYGLKNLGFIFYSIPQGLVLMSCCYVGYLLKQYKLLQRWVYDIRAYLVLLPIALAEIKWGSVIMYKLQFHNVVLDMIGATAMAILFLMIGLWLGEYNWRATEGIKEAGVYSFWILAVHGVEDAVIPWAELAAVLPVGPRVYTLLMIVVRFGIIAGGVLLVKKITKYNFARRKKNGEKRLR